MGEHLSGGRRAARQVKNIPAHHNTSRHIDPGMPSLSLAASFRRRKQRKKELSPFSLLRKSAPGFLPCALQDLHFPTRSLGQWLRLFCDSCPLSEFSPLLPPSPPSLGVQVFCNQATLSWWAEDADAAHRATGSASAAPEDGNSNLTFRLYLRPPIFVCT